MRPPFHEFRAYDRESVRRFLVAFCAERAARLEHVASARLRVATALETIALAAETTARTARLVPDAKHRVRAERLANERAIASILAAAESEADSVLAAACADVRDSPTAQALEREPASTWALL